MLEGFKKADFVSVAIDEWSTAKTQNVDFVIENPLLPIKPYPVSTQIITSANAEGYVHVLLDRLNNIHFIKLI